MAFMEKYMQGAIEKSVFRLARYSWFGVSPLPSCRPAVGQRLPVEITAGGFHSAPPPRECGLGAVNFPKTASEWLAHRELMY